MKILLLFVSCALIANGTLAQKSTSKKVKTQHLSIPNYDVSSTDVSSLKSYVSIGNSTYGPNKLMDGKTICVVKGGSLKDAKEITTYYYQHDVQRPATYLFLEDGSGNTIYAGQVAPQATAKADYGKEQCEFWIKASLIKKYESEKTSWESSDHAAFVKSMKEATNRELKNNGLVSYIPLEIEVYSAKGKGMDYKAIEEAYTLAFNAYESISSNGLSQQSYDDLGKAISTWESELQQADLKDKEARINKKVAQGLFINLTYAHMFRNEMEKAAINAQKADESFGNFTTNKRTEIQNLRMDVNRRKPAVDKNTSLLTDFAKLNEMAQQSRSINMMLQDYIGSTEDARAAYESFAGEEMAAATIAAEDANIAAGGSSYDKYVVPNSIPKTLTIMKLQEELTEFPVGITQISGLANVSIAMNSIASIPEQIGNMESLKKLTLSKNKITELPSSIGSCSNLTGLNLSGNPISALPESIKNCKKLKSLNLKNTKVSADHVTEIQGWLPKCKIKI